MRGHNLKTGAVFTFNVAKICSFQIKNSNKKLVEIETPKLIFKMTTYHELSIIFKLSEQAN